MNRVCLIGRITKDVELRYTPNQKAVVSFVLAVARDKDTTDFIGCVVWNKQAENLEKYCGKGDLIGIDGSLRTRNYDNAQGQKVYVTEVLCNSIQYLNNRNRETTVVEEVRNEISQDQDYKFDIMEDDLQF